MRVEPSCATWAATSCAPRARKAGPPRRLCRRNRVCRSHARRPSCATWAATYRARRARKAARRADSAAAIERTARMRVKPQLRDLGGKVPRAARVQAGLPRRLRRPHRAYRSHARRAQLCDLRGKVRRAARVQAAYPAGSAAVSGSASQRSARQPNQLRPELIDSPHPAPRRNPRAPSTIQAPRQAQRHLGARQRAVSRRRFSPSPRHHAPDALQPPITPRAPTPPHAPTTPSAPTPPDPDHANRPSQP